jgi:ribosome maturation factor RimP
MTENPVVTRVSSLITPIVADLGLELYDLEFAGGMLRVTVDTPPGSPGGVDVDQLARCTRLISRDLDHEDPIPGHYTLEVSSPGLERNLRLPRHFQREIGKSVAVRLRDAIGGERRITGLLISASEEAFTLRLDNGEERHIAYDHVDKARTVFVWPAQARQTPSRAGSGSKKSSTSKSPASPADSEAENDDLADELDLEDDEFDGDFEDDIDDIDQNDENDHNEDQEHAES